MLPADPKIVAESVNDRMSPREMIHPYLIGESDAEKGKQIPLSKPRFVIGRDETSSDLIVDRPFISRHHAAFESNPSGRTTIKDLDSKLGTFVNGERVVERVLADGDLVGLGPGGQVQFRFWYPKQPKMTVVMPGGFGVAPARNSQDSDWVAVDVGGRELVRLGRAPDNDIVFDGEGVSRHHAELRFSEDKEAILADCRSTNGTYVNGEVLRRPRRIGSADLIYLGGFLVRLDGRRVMRSDLRSSRISARGLTQRFDKNEKDTISNIDLPILPGQFIGLMGPSGSGKSTLLEMLNGSSRPRSGQVYVNELNLHDHFAALSPSIGYVPQKDELHESLSVQRTLYYVAKLRLPAGVRSAELQKTVETVMKTVGLEGHGATSFGQLSGGQKKRLNMGIELITNPPFLFLDEPTSPLDPKMSEDMMARFRNLADRGQIVVIVTHKFERFFDMDRVAMLSKDGEKRGACLAYFGPPQAALDYFQCESPRDIFVNHLEKGPERLEEQFRSSNEYDRYVVTPMKEAQSFARQQSTPAAAMEGAKPRRGSSAFSQWSTLTRRTLEIKLKDRKNTGLLLAQAPVVAVILVAIVGSHVNDAKTLFISAIIAIWFGGNNAIRDIVTERTIYSRERKYGLKIPGYVLSKFVVLGLIGLVQCLLFLWILIQFGLFRSGDFGNLLAILYLTTLGGVATALFFSALVNTAEKAITLLPLFLIPQLLLGGFLKPIRSLYVDLSTGKPAAAEQYERFREFQKRSTGSAALQGATGRPVTPPDPVAKYGGLGMARPASALMIARWSIEGLAHTVGLNDLKARDKLATQIYVPGYSLTLEGKGPGEVRDVYRRQLSVDIGLLGAFILVFLGLTMWVLKRKDSG